MASLHVPRSLKAVNALKSIRRSKTECETPLQEAFENEALSYEDPEEETHPKVDSPKFIDEGVHDLDGTILGLEHLQIASPQMKRVRFWDDGESSGYDSCDSDGVPARRPKGASAKLHKKKSTPQNPSQKTSMLRLFQGKFHENSKCLKSLVNYYQTILH